MDALKTTLTQRIAKAAAEFHKHCTGRTPESVSVFLGEDMLVITLYGALSPAELVLAQRSDGAGKVQEFHRQLFAASSLALINEIKRITGLDVREAAAQVESPAGAVVHAFTTGTIVQVFHLARFLPIHPAADLASSPMSVGHSPIAAVPWRNDPSSITLHLPA